MASSNQGKRHLNHDSSDVNRTLFRQRS